MNIALNLIITALLEVLGDKLELSYLCGSYASGRATEDSDIDLAILPRSPIKPLFLRRIIIACIRICNLTGRIIWPRLNSVGQTEESFYG